MNQDKVFIVDANRTAVGSLGKSLKNITADSLGSEVIRNTLIRSEINCFGKDIVVSN